MPPRAPLPFPSEAAFAFAKILFANPPRFASCISTADRIRSSNCGTFRQ